MLKSRQTTVHLDWKSEYLYRAIRNSALKSSWAAVGACCSVPQVLPLLCIRSGAQQFIEKHNSGNERISCVNELRDVRNRQTDLTATVKPIVCQTADHSHELHGHGHEFRGSLSRTRSKSVGLASGSTCSCLAEKTHTRYCMYV